MLMAAAKLAAVKAFRKFIIPRVLTAYRKRAGLTNMATRAAAYQAATTQNKSNESDFHDDTAHGSKFNQTASGKAFATFSSSFQNLKEQSEIFGREQFNKNSSKLKQFNWIKLRKYVGKAVKGGISYGFQRELYEKFLKPGFEAVYPANSPKAKEAPKSEGLSQPNPTPQSTFDIDDFDVNSPTRTVDMMASKYELLKQAYPDVIERKNVLYEQVFGSKIEPTFVNTSTSTESTYFAPKFDDPEATIFGDFDDSSFDVNLHIVLLILEEMENEYPDADSFPESHEDVDVDKIERLKAKLEWIFEHPEEACKMLEKFFD